MDDDNVINFEALLSKKSEEDAESEKRAELVAEIKKLLDKALNDESVRIVVLAVTDKGDHETEEAFHISIGPAEASYLCLKHAVQSL